MVPSCSKYKMVAPFGVLVGAPNFFGCGEMTKLLAASVETGFGFADMVQQRAVSPLAPSSRSPRMTAGWLWPDSSSFGRLHSDRTHLQRL